MAIGRLQVTKGIPESQPGQDAVQDDVEHEVILIADGDRSAHQLL
jgi:hypothetical protein